MKRIVTIMTCICLMLSLCACQSAPESGNEESAYPNAKVITLNGNSAALDGTALTEYDYVWSYDPSQEEPSYTGTEPGDDAVYIAHDVIYYPEIGTDAFEKAEYDGETEWVTHYTAEGLEDYVFATLPVLGEDLPTEMMHSADEAYKNPVLHITEPGEYILEGSWQGQIKIDLGDKDETFTDENAKVTLILNGADIECTVAPAVLFYSAYECDNAWEERDEYNELVDLTNAGAKVILADGSENNVTGANVYRILKPVYKSDDGTVQKKLVKTDGAFYSYVSMTVGSGEAGTGILNLRSATYEGLDSELHLGIESGYVNIVSQDDGINVNEDGVSVFCMDGGHVTIFAGQGAEGDVIDSNGFIRINGGFIAGTSPSPSDNMLDSDCGTTVSDDAVVISSTSGAKMPGQGMGEDIPEPPQGGFDPGQQPGGGFAPDKPDGAPPMR